MNTTQKRKNKKIKTQKKLKKKLKKRFKKGGNDNKYNYSKKRQKDNLFSLILVTETPIVSTNSKKNKTKIGSILNKKISVPEYIEILNNSKKSKVMNSKINAEKIGQLLNISDLKDKNKLELPFSFLIDMSNNILSSKVYNFHKLPTKNYLLQFLKHFKNNPDETSQIYISPTTT